MQGNIPAVTSFISNHVQTVAPPGKNIGRRNDALINVIFAELNEIITKTIGTLAFRRCSLIGIPKVGYCTSYCNFFIFVSLELTILTGS